MYIQPINTKNINFKANNTLPAAKKADNSAATNQNNNTLVSIPAAMNPINIKTPISYKKIADLTVPQSEEKAQFYKMSNGHKVVILPGKGPMVIRSYFNVGSLNEPDHLRGISHYIEHNLFNGSENIAPGEFFQKISDIGGNTNASTGHNRTDYYIKAPLAEKNCMQKIVELHTDQIQNPQFAQTQLDKERGPVVSEINMYADNPYNITQNVTLKNLFGIQSTSADLIAGSVSNINSITQEDVRNYYNTWYTPDNCTTVVTGTVSPEKIMELMSTNCTKQAAAKPQNRKFENLIPIAKTARVDIKHPNCVGTIINMGFAGPENNNTRDKIALELLISLLAGSSRFPLNKTLEKYQTSALLQGQKIGNKPNDRMEISLTIPTNEEKAETVLKEVFKSISDFKKTPVTQEDFDSAKMKLKISLARLNETSQGINEYIGNAFLDNDFDYMSNYEYILNSITPAELYNAANKYFDLNKTAITVMHPASASNEQIKNNYTRANTQKAPSVAFKGSFHGNIIDEIYSNAKQYILPNNIKTSIYPSSNNLTSTFMLDFSMPSCLDITEPEVLLLGQILNRGSAFKDNDAFTDLADKNNISLGFAASPSGISVSSLMPSQNLSVALDLVREALNNPRFTQEDFDWAKENIKEMYQYKEKSASDKLAPALFPNLKFITTPQEVLKQVETLSLERIQSIYNQIMSNVSGSAVLAAPIKQNPQLESYFLNYLSQNFRTLNPSTPTITKTYTPNSKPIVLKEADERIQAEILQTYKFRSSENIEDEAKIGILDTILGANSSSRLFSDLRESQKLAYQVKSSYLTLGNTGYIALKILTTTDNSQEGIFSPENVQKSLDGFGQHVKAIKSEPVTENELKKAKLIMKNRILNSLETSDDIASDIISNQNTCYGIEKTKLLLEAIDKITAKDIQNTANYVFADAPITSILASQKTLDALNN